MDCDAQDAMGGPNQGEEDDRNGISAKLGSVNLVAGQSLPLRIQRWWQGTRRRSLWRVRRRGSIEEIGRNAVTELAPDLHEVAELT